MSVVSFENLFFTILPGHILYMECTFGNSYGRTYKAQLSSKSRGIKAVLCSSKLKNFKRNLNTFIRIFFINTPVLALKSVKRGGGGGRVFWNAVLWLCFKLPICLFGHTRDTSVI